MGKFNIKGPALPFMLVSALFLLWGVANNMNDTLLAAFKRIMSMSDLQTSLCAVCILRSLFLFCPPCGHVHKALFLQGGNPPRAFALRGRHNALLPCRQRGLLPVFPVCHLCDGRGCAVLETTANPYVISMGPQDSATRRLNVAQTLNPVGAVAGILLSRHFILSELSEAGAAERAGMSTDALNALQHRELDAISGTYMLIGVILLALLATIAFIKMPGEKDHSSPLDIKSTIRRLWGKPQI